MTMNKISIISFSDTLPRIHHRIIQINKFGYKTKTYYFKREFNRINNFENDPESVCLGTLKDGKFYKRILKIKAASKKVKKENYSKSAYCFGWDGALVAILSGYTKIILEIGDLRITPETKRLKKLFFKPFEYFILKRINSLAITSDKFRDYFSSYSLNINYIHVKNQLPESIIFNREFKKTFSNDKIRLGYIGSIRYKTIFSLKDLIERYPDKFDIKIYGGGPLEKKFKQECSMNKSISFFGPFKNPKDLERIYSEIDVSYVAYDTDSYNVRVALPNKLYESIFFQVPIIVSKNTYLSEYVSSYGIGYIIDSQDLNKSLELISSINNQDLKTKAINISKIDDEEIIFNTDKFGAELKKIFN